MNASEYPVVRCERHAEQHDCRPDVARMAESRAKAIQEFLDKETPVKTWAVTAETTLLSDEQRRDGTVTALIDARPEAKCGSPFTAWARMAGSAANTGSSAAIISSRIGATCKAHGRGRGFGVAP